MQREERGGIHPWKRNLLSNWYNNSSFSDLLSSSRTHDSDADNDNRNYVYWERASANTTTASSLDSSSQVSGVGDTLRSDSSMPVAAPSPGLTRDGYLFQEKICLLKRSIQRQSAILEQKQREKESRTLMGNKHPSPQSPNVVTSEDGREEGKYSFGVEWNGKEDVTARSERFLSISPPPPLRGQCKVGGKGDTMNAMDVENTPVQRRGERNAVRIEAGLTGSPAVEVILEEDSPLHAMQQRETITTGGISVGAVGVITPPQPRGSGCGPSFCNDDDNGNGQVYQTDKNDSERERSRKHEKKNDSNNNNKNNNNDNSNNTGVPNCGGPLNATITLTTQSRRGIERPNTQNITSESHLSNSTLHDAATQTNTTRTRVAPPKRTAEIRTLRAPSKCSVNSDNNSNDTNSNTNNSGCLRKQARHTLVTRSEASVPPSLTGTRNAYDGGSNARASGSENVDFTKPEPRNQRGRNAGLSQGDIERVLNHSTDHVLLVDGRSMSSENPSEETLQMFRRRSTTPTNFSRTQGSLRNRMNDSCDGSSNRRYDCEDNGLVTRGHSPTLMEPWTQEATGPRRSTSVPTRSLSNTRNRLKSHSTPEQIANANQRRCLLRQIKLIDAEIHRLENVPWSKSLRLSGDGSSRLNAERSKLILVRRHYEEELQRLLRTFVQLSGSVPPPPPPPPLPLSSDSLSPRRECSASKPRDGPSVYEALWWENFNHHHPHQQQQRWGKGELIQGESHPGCVAEGNTVAKRTRKGDGNDNIERVTSLPPRSTTRMKCRPKTHAMQSSERSRSLSKDSRSIRRRDLGEVRRSRSNISLDAERMAALYRRSASSSRRGGTPLRDSTTMSVASSEDVSHVMSHDVPLYWRVAQESHPAYNRPSKPPSEMMEYEARCNPTSLPTHEQNGGASYNTSATELCSDIPADRYYCAEYGEDDGEDERWNSTRRTNAGSSAARRSTTTTTTTGTGTRKEPALRTEGSVITRSSSTAQPPALQQQEQQQQQVRHQSSSQTSRPQVSAHKAGVRLTGVMGAVGRERSNRSGLCYQLRAPALQAAAGNSELKRLCFRPDLMICAVGSETTAVPPQSLSNEEQLSTYLEMEEKSRLQQHTGGHAGYVPPLSQLSSKTRQLEQPDNSPFVNHTCRSIDTVGGTVPSTSSVSSSLSLPPSSTEERVFTTGHFHFNNGYTGNKGDELGWISPPRRRNFPPTVECTPPPPPPPSQKTKGTTTTYQSGYHAHHQEGADGRTTTTTTNNNNNNTNKRSRHTITCKGSSEMWHLSGKEGHVIEDGTPSNQQLTRQQEEQAQPVNSPPSSEVRVSPLTEYSGCGESPVAELPCRRPNGSMERGPDFRKVMTRYRQRSLSNSHSLPRPMQEATSSTKGPATGTVSSPFFTSKTQRRLGNDCTNGILHSDVSSSMQLSPNKGGNGGITLRQMFGHSGNVTYSSKGTNKENVGGNGLSSTDVLLGRINQMRAQMK